MRSDEGRILANSATTWECLAGDVRHNLIFVRAPATIGFSATLHPAFSLVGLLWLPHCPISGWYTAEVDGGGREVLADIAERMNRVLLL